MSETNLCGLFEGPWLGWLSSSRYCWKPSGHDGEHCTCKHNGACVGCRVDQRRQPDPINEPAHYQTGDDDTVHGLLVAIQTAVYAYDGVASVHGPGPEDGPCWLRWKETVRTVIEAVEKLAKRWPVDNGGEYSELDRVLAMARAQAAEGKGKDRHAVQGQPFEEQVIVADSVALGSNHGNLLQIIKKGKESARLPKDRAIAELLGVINNAAAAILVLEKLDEMERNR